MDEVMKVGSEEI